MESLPRNANNLENPSGRWISLPNRNSLANFRNHFSCISFLYSIAFSAVSQARLTSHQISPGARLCPVAIVTHETTVIAEEETEEAGRNLSLPPKEKDQDHPSKGKMP